MLNCTVEISYLRYVTHEQCMHVCCNFFANFHLYAQACYALPFPCRHSHHDNGIWYLFYMLKDSSLLQIHKLPNHGNNFQHIPDDDLYMLPFCLFCLLMKNRNLVKWAS